MARRMVCEYGMSTAIGSQALGSGNQELMFLGREVSRTQQYSEATAQRIDAEVSRLLQEAYARAEKVITEHRTLLDKIVERLLEIETMDGREVDELVEHGRFLTEEERAVRDKEAEAAEAVKKTARDAAQDVTKNKTSKTPGYEPPPSPLIPPPKPPSPETSDSGSGDAGKASQI
jgi:cell division protease FtsH